MIQSPPDFLSDLTLQQLRVFCDVVRRQSYAGAARAMGYSTPTVWSHVRAVERRYGVRLFERRGRNVAPTSVGQRLAESISAVLAGFESTYDLVRQTPPGTPVILHVVAGMRMMMEELVRALAVFRANHPAVSLRLEHGDRKSVEARVGDGTASLGLTLETGQARSAQHLSYQPAYEISHLAVAPPGHPLCTAKTLSLARLVEHPLVVGHPQTVTRQLLDQALHRHRLLDRARIVVETDNSAFTIACVRQGMGVGVMAGQPDGGLVSGLAVKALRPHMGVARIVFVTRRGAVPGPALEALMASIRTIAPRSVSSDGDRGCVGSVATKAPRRRR